MSSMNINTILIGMVAGSIGLGYYLYGKKRERPVPMVCGIALMVYPYFIADLWTILGVGLVLMLAPAVIKI
jgi:hypothetical protein